jgi:hypothetical protein
VCDEDAADTEVVPYSAVKSLAPTASTTDADDVDKGHSPNWVIGDSSSGGDELGSP